MKAPDNALVGTSSGEIVAENQSRRGMFLANLSANNIFLGFGSDAVLNKGYKLLPGQCFSMSAFEFTWEAVNAISDTADSLISIQEFE